MTIRNYIKMRKQILFLFCVSLFTVSLRGQGSSQQLPKVVPPSPNVAAIQRYGEIPVSPYTGVPNISIPLYSIKTNNLSLPVSVSYHASGIRVADEASRVGLGWALNAGGVISRTIMGEDDFLPDHTRGYHLDANTADIPKGYRGSPQPYFAIQNGANVDVGGINNLASLLNTDHQFQPDVYNFSIGNVSGKFFLKRNKEVVLSTKEKISIKCMDANADAWEIQTADGIKYKFNVYETYTENGFAPGLSTATHKTAWYLTQIISPNDETIDLQYRESTNYIKPLGSFFESYNPNTILTTEPVNCGQSASPFPTVTTVSPGKDYRNLILDKIIFQNGEIKFSYANDRIDLVHDVRLTDIKVYSKNSSGTSQLLKEWSFSYGYFTGSATNSFLATGSDQETKRLKLDAITEKDASGNALPPHSFTYHNDDSYTSTYPSKASFSRDHWGYYNGKPNYSLIPNHSAMSVPNNPALTYLGSMGDNREPSSTLAQLFSLKEIKYPTGGKTLLEYETHDYDIEKSNVNDHSYYRLHPEGAPKQIQKMYYPVVSEMPTASDLADKTLDLTDLYGSTTSKVSLIAFFRFGNTMTSCAFQPGIVSFKLTTEDGGVIAQSDLADWLGASYEPMATCDPPSDPVGITFKNSYFLSPGKYVWKVSIAPGYGQILDIKLTLDYTANKASQDITNGGDVLTKAGLGGGLRIKRISDYESNTATPKVKRYSYHYTDNEGKTYSYGRRMARPIYSYYDDSWTTTDCGQTNTTSSTTSQHLIRESDSNVPLNGSASGSTVGYDKVIVFYGENGENGKTEYEFENEPDVVWNYSENSSLFGVPTTLPRKPPVQGSFSNSSNGNILKQTDYENVDGDFIKVKELTNIYTEMLGQNNSLWWGIEKRKFNGQYPILSTTYPFRAYVYPTIVETRKLLTSSSVTTFDKSNSNLSITQTTENTYDNDSHLQLTNTKQLNSKGDQIINSFSYPLDYVNADADEAILEMKGASYMHGKVIRSNTSIIKTGASSPLLIHSEISKYEKLGAKVLLKEVAKLENISGVTTPTYQPSSGTYPAIYKPNIQIDLYDAKGNILQMSKTSDIKHSYIWGYDNTYPVAEITGVEYNTIMTGVNLDQNILQSPSNDLALRNELNKIRTSFPNVLVNTYTYKPLVGMTSSTDANNRTAFYEYDAFGRLFIIRDQDNNILKKICYNFAGQPESCGVVTPLWTSTGVTRCKQCSLNASYTTNVQEHQEKDMNPESPSYGDLRWIEDGPSTNCATADWQNTTTAKRCKTVNGLYTGIQEQEQKDMNPCSQTANELRWVDAGQNTSSCPLPINISAYNLTNKSYFIHFDDVASTANYTLSIPANSQNGVIGQVPPGTYNILFQPSGQPEDLLLGIGSFSTHNTGASFSNVSITSATQAYVNY